MRKKLKCVTNELQYDNMTGVFPDMKFIKVDLVKLSDDSNLDKGGCN